MFAKWLQSGAHAESATESAAGPVQTSAMALGITAASNVVAVTKPDSIALYYDADGCAVRQWTLPASVGERLTAPAVVSGHAVHAVVDARQIVTLTDDLSSYSSRTTASPVVSLSPCCAVCEDGAVVRLSDHVTLTKVPTPVAAVLHTTDPVHVAVQCGDDNRLVVIDTSTVQTRTFDLGLARPVRSGAIDLVTMQAAVVTADDSSLRFIDVTRGQQLSQDEIASDVVVVQAGGGSVFFVGTCAWSGAFGVPLPDVPDDAVAVAAVHNATHYVALHASGDVARHAMPSATLASCMRRRRESIGEQERVTDLSAYLGRLGERGPASAQEHHRVVRDCIARADWDALRAIVQRYAHDVPDGFWAALLDAGRHDDVLAFLGSVDVDEHDLVGIVDRVAPLASPVAARILSRALALPTTSSFLVPSLARMSPASSVALCAHLTGALRRLLHGPAGAADLGLHLQWVADLLDAQAPRFIQDARYRPALNDLHDLVRQATRCVPVAADLLSLLAATTAMKQPSAVAAATPAHGGPARIESVVW